MSNHYVWAGGFLALTVGGIGYGAVSGVQASLAAPHATAAVHGSEADQGGEGHGASVSSHGASASSRGASASSHGAGEGGAHGEPKGSIDPREDLRQSMRAAIFLGRQGEFAAAAEALEELTHAHPSQASVWLNLGIARLGTRDLAGAEAAFMRTLSIAPADWDAHAELANVALDRGDLDQALAHAHKIPAQKGRMQDRLRNDSRWRAHLTDPRVGELRVRHGLDASPAQSEKLQHELELRRQLAAAETPPAEGTQQPDTSASAASVGTPEATTESPAASESEPSSASASDEPAVALPSEGEPSQRGESSATPSEGEPSEGGETSTSPPAASEGETDASESAELSSDEPSWARRLPTESSSRPSVDPERLGVSPHTY